MMDNIELYIDGVKVILPSDFEATVIQENTFITKSGEYSYDLNLRLDNPVNAQIYRHINRVNAVFSISNRKAILIINNRVVLNGTEKILSIDGIFAKIQILSGNAELNYFGSEELLINLDLGSVASVTAAAALLIKNNVYGDSNYIFPPVKTSSGVINDMYIYIPLIGTNDELRYKEDTQIIAQPFLLHYINAIPEALGYKVVSNFLNDNWMLKRAYMVNVVSTLSLAKMLPSAWTANRFISAIEKQFNVVFVANRINKTVRILRYADWITTNIEEIEVIDEFSIPIEKTEIEKIDYDFVDYNLPSDKYYEYARLSDYAKQNLTHNYYGSFAALKSAVTANPSLDGGNKALFHCGENTYIYKDNLLQLVDQFAAYGDSDANKVTLDIIPAIITKQAVPVLWGSNWSDGDFYQLPELNVNTKLPTVTTLDEVLTYNKTNELNELDVLAVALYLGETAPRKDDTTAAWGYGRILSSQTDIYSIIGQNVEIINYPYGSTDANYLTLTMRLTGTNGLKAKHLTDLVQIDNTKRYVFDFVVKDLPDARSKFIIRNREFICEKLEYKYASGSKLSIARGYFFPIL